MGLSNWSSYTNFDQKNVLSMKFERNHVLSDRLGKYKILMYFDIENLSLKPI